MSSEEYDVIVVGAGNAAMCAAMAAEENGAKVVVLERANEDEAGGNSRYTAGALRFAHNGMQDILTLVDLTDEEIQNNDFGTYTTDQFFDDMFRVTQYRTDPELCEILVTQSLDTTKWMHSKGIRFMPMYGRQAFKVDGKMKFWGGLALEFWGGGPGIWEMESKIVRDLGIPIKFEHRVIELLYDEQQVYGVKVKHKGEVSEIRGKSVVLASGWIRGEFGLAYAIFGSWLGFGESERDSTQYGRRHQDGFGHRRHALWQLVRLSRCRLGFERSRVR